MTLGYTVSPVRSALVAAGLLTLGGCVAQAPYDVPAPPPPAVVRAAPDTKLYVYPAAGQSDEQLARDRYECHVWAVKQTGFDPSASQVAPHERVEVVAMPSGSNTAAGAVTGALLGAAVSRPREAGAGALLGALTGAIIGSASDQARADQSAAIAAQVNARNDRDDMDQRAAGYRRALGACLQGRSYTVK